MALWSVGIHVYPGPKGLVLSWCAATWLLLCFVVQPRQVWAQRILAVGNGFLLLGLVAICGALLSYWTLRTSPFAWADSTLLSADLRLGLDWRSLYTEYSRLSDFHLHAQRLYLAISDIPTMIIVALGLSGKERMLQALIGAFAAALCITLMLSFFMPAITPLIYLFGGNPPYVPATGVGYFAVIKEVRSGVPMNVELHQLYGLLTFPSFHAASAIIFAWAGWSLRYLRWPFLALNIGMLVVTPMEGAHYFVDLFGGVLVALAAIVIVQRRVRPLGTSDIRDCRVAIA